MEAVTSKTLSESVYARLRSDIIGGRLPPNAKLRVNELRLAYHTGASPLREALSRLAGEGFVTASGQRGFTVAPISLKDLDDITRLRILLECEALRDAIAGGDDGWEAQVVAAFHHLGKVEGAREERPDEWEARNQAFHEALVAACDSEWVLRLRRTLYEQHRRYRMISLHAHDSSRDVQAEHQAILDAVLARDATAACRAIETHILRTAQTTRAAFAACASAAHSG